MESYDQDDITDLVENTKDWLGNWFEDIRRWSSENAVDNERHAWIKIFGIPQHV